MGRASIHWAIRRFFESRIWTFLTLGLVALNIALGSVGTALGLSINYFVIYGALAWIRRIEREVHAKRAELQAVIDQEPRTLH